MGEQQYTYKDWKTGKVVLAESLNKDTIKKYIPEISLNKFSSEDQKSILGEQQTIFEKERQKQFLSFITDYQKRVSRSMYQRGLLENEIRDYDSLFGYGEDVLGSPNFTGILEGKLSNDEIICLRKYHVKHIVNGELDIKLYVLHPSSQKKESKPYFTSYAVALFEYYLWLKRSWVSIEGRYKELGIESLNPYPRIFPDYMCYMFFEEMKTLLIRDETIQANYAFIFYAFEEKGLIYKKLKHEVFIDFLKEHCEPDLSITQLKYKNQDGNRQIFKVRYSAFIEDYQVFLRDGLNKDQ